MKNTVCKILALMTASVFFTIHCGADRIMPRVVDNADILTDYEEDKLISQLDELSERHQFDVAVYTTESLGGFSSMNLADKIYEDYGYGFTSDHDGAMLLIAMDEREWWITTEGYGITALNDYNLMLIEDEMLSYLSSGDYYSAFSTFAGMCDTFVTDAIEGYPSYPDADYDDYYSSDNNGYYSDYYYPDYRYPSEYSTGIAKTSPTLIFTALFFGFIIAFIVVSVMKGQLKSVKKAYGAASYEVPGSFSVTRSRDIFLYRNISKRRIDNDTNRSPHSGHRSGGSSVHSSSSGRSHGGRGGRF